MNAHMYDDELWQRYSNNGAPIIDKGAPAKDFRENPQHIKGTSHVWFWKRTHGTVEVLLQKRSLSKLKMPGMYHMSAGGHINLGENSLDAALRETKEEMGIDLNVNKLHYVATIRVVETSPNDITNIFLYELVGDEEFTYGVSEVDSHMWMTARDFKKITQYPKNNNLVDQGPLYFGMIIASLEYVSKSAM